MFPEEIKQGKKVVRARYLETLRVYLPEVCGFFHSVPSDTCYIWLIRGGDDKSSLLHRFKYHRITE